MDIELEKILLLTKTDFEKELAYSVFVNLKDKTNKLRFNNFAVSLRELSRHILKRLSPDEKILNCCWYVNEIPDKTNGITRGQRIKYAVQGGLPDNYILETLKYDFSKQKKNLSNSINLLSKYTHIEELTFNLSEKKVDELVNDVSTAFEDLFKSINSCHEELTTQLDEILFEIISEQATEGTIENVDILSTHYRTNSIDINSVKVTLLDNESINFSVFGGLNITQQYGSDSDLRNDIGLETETSFPFESKLKTKIIVLPKLAIEKIQFLVDTDDEYEISEEELEKLIDEEIDRHFEEKE